MDLTRLREPFPPDAIEWRVQQSGKNGEKSWAMVLAYVTSRAIMDRLDEVCGPGNWCNEFKAAPDGGILCGISIRLDDGGWVTKWDGAENTDIEAVKGGLSNATKRAAVQWGIGRYLYKLESKFVDVKASGEHRIHDKKSGVQGYWDTPKLPDWALPEKTKAKGKGKPQETPAPTPPADPREPQRPAYISRILAIAGANPHLSIKGIDLTPEGLQPLSMDTLAAIGQQLKGYIAQQTANNSAA